MKKELLEFISGMEVLLAQLKSQLNSQSNSEETVQTIEQNNSNEIKQAQEEEKQLPNKCDILKQFLDNPSWSLAVPPVS